LEFQIDKEIIRKILVNLINNVRKKNPTKVDKSITVILLAKVKEKRLLAYLYFLEILSLK